MEALEARRREVGPGREGLMALASAGCEMSSSSYTAGPRPELPGLWAAELASVASMQALQRDGWRDCEAGGSGRRGWHEPGTGWPGPQVAALGRGARAHGRPRGSAYGLPPRCRDGGPAFPAIISSVQSKEALDRPCYGRGGVSQTCHRSSSHVPWFLHGFRSFAIWSCGCVFRD